MNVVFKICESENNKLSKDFASTTANFDVDFKSESSVFEPIIIIGTTYDLSQYNYAEIADFGRKYFINDIKVLRTNLYEIHLHVDVLSTYESEIRNLTAVVKRQENNFNLYLDDSEFKVYNNSLIQTNKFSNSGFTKNLQYVLVTAGG